MLTNLSFYTISFNSLGRFEDWRVKITPSNGTYRENVDSSCLVQAVMTISIRENDCTCDGKAKLITNEGKGHP